MPDIDQAQAQNAAERIRQAVADVPFAINDPKNITVTVSVGLAFFEVDGDTPDSILKRADVALYAAKNQGRNRVVSDAA
jgi:two-component system, cell cycle response regulator